MLMRKGAMTDAAHEVGGFIKTDPLLDRPDAQLGSMLVTMSQDESGKVVLDSFPGMRLLGYFTRPESRGWTHITAPDPAKPPAIAANHFAEDVDRQKAIALFKKYDLDNNGSLDFDEYLCVMKARPFRCR